jgi:hypothetical protein
MATRILYVVEKGYKHVGDILKTSKAEIRTEKNNL